MHLNAVAPYLEDDAVSSKKKNFLDHASQIKKAQTERKLSANQTPQLITGQKEALWHKNISLAKQCMHEISKARYRVVQLALEVCDIQHGGGAHWSKHQGLYTLQMFAKEINLNYKTLTNWVAIQRNLIDHLDPGEYKEDDFKYAHRACKVVGRVDHRAAVAEFRRQKSKQKTEYKIETIVQWSRSHMNYLKRVDIQALPDKQLQALRQLCLMIIELIDAKEKTGKKDHQAKM